MLMKGNPMNEWINEQMDGQMRRKEKWVEERREENTRQTRQNKTTKRTGQIKHFTIIIYTIKDS